jgi:hypothetical protein
MNFVSSNGILCNIISSNLIKRGWNRFYPEIEIGIEYKKYEEKDEDTKKEVIKNKISYDIKAYFTDKHIKHYVCEKKIEQMYNHIMNMAVFTNFSLLHKNLLANHPKTVNKYFLKCYQYDIADLKYDFITLKEKIDVDLISDKKYILKPYKYTNIEENKIIKNKDDNILDYFTSNKYNCSNWMVMKKSKMIESNDNSVSKFKINVLITISKDNVTGYVYKITDFVDNNEIATRCYKLLKKIFDANLKFLICANFYDFAFEMISCDFLITNQNKIKLIDVTTNFDKIYDNNNKVYYENFVNDTLNLLLDTDKTNFKMLKKIKYNHFTDALVDSFSYYDYHRIDEELEKIKYMCDNLKKYSLTFLYDKSYQSIRIINDKKLIDNKYNKRYTLVAKSRNDYLKYNGITNIIIERCNALCRFGQSKTMLELANDRKVISNIMTEMYNNNSDITPKKIAGQIYRRTKICTYFPVNIVFGFIKHFGAKSYLDISTGWGDRLIAACLADIVYYGADPNTCNEVYYNQMIEMFGNKKKQKVVITGFENLEITDTYDLIFSSPPFFELEKYSNDLDQSHLKYTSERSWVNDFLFVVLKKAWKHLNNDGHMCLYMNDYYKISYCEDMVKFCVENLPNCKYLGVIGITIEPNLNQPISDTEPEPEPIRSNPLWVFQKSVAFGSKIE